MAKLHCHFKNYIKVANHYKSLLNSEFVQAGTPIWAEVSQSIYHLSVWDGFVFELMFRPLVPSS